MVGLGIKYLEVEPIVGILQEATFIFSEELCPLSKKIMEDITSMPHGFKLPFSILIMGLFVDEDKTPLIKCVWVDVGFIMGLRPGLSRFGHLDSSAKVLIGLLKHK